MKSLLKLNKYLLKYKSRLLLGFLFVILNNFFLVLTPKYIGQAIDILKSSKISNEIYHFIGFAVGSAIVSGVFMLLVRRTIIITSRRIEFDIKNDFYAHLQKLSLSFFKQRSTGDLMARASNDLSAVRNYFGPAIMYSINTVFRLVFILSAMIIISPSLTLFALLPAPVLSYSVYKIGQLVHKQTKILQKYYGDLTTRVQENLSGIRVVKSYTREEHEQIRFSKFNEAYYKQNLKLARLQGLFYTATTGLLGLSILIVLWSGGYKVIESEITLGDIAQFLIYIGMLSWPLVSIGWITNMVQRAAAANKRLEEIFNTQPEIVDSNEVNHNIKDLSGHVKFNNVSFAYAQNSEFPVLKNISFELTPGIKLAIVGATGSGKSTLVNLLPRLIDVTGGEILFDGTPINKVPLNTLRNAIGFVPQDYFLFSDTIRENIGFGLPNYTEEDIERAAKQAMIYNDIMDFPNKMESMLGERGITLSGGQKQRTSIARALIRKPKILVLDDSLSAVDTKTESLFLKNLGEFSDQMTVILISHRISSVKDFDKILVLDHGEIVEHGTHQELLDQNAIYAELYEKQLLEEELTAID